MMLRSDAAIFVSRMALAGVILAVLGATAQTQADIIDQSNTAAVTQFFNTSQANPPIGQEFTPTLAGLNFVDLHIDDAEIGDVTGASFHVNVRLGTITGTIVGTSNTVFVPPGTNTGGGSTITRLLFPGLVPLVPGTLYVLDVVQLPPIVPNQNNNFGIDGNFGNTYAAGRAIIGGTPNTDFDFFFREGLALVPEPGSLALAAVGSLGLLGFATRRRRCAA